jgi:hydroxymethylglutaryl-CoA reductase (NADPH)
MKIPSLILRQLYTFGSLSREGDGLSFTVKNRLADSTLTGLKHVRVDGEAIPRERMALRIDGGATLTAEEVTKDHPVDFPLKRTVEILVDEFDVSPGMHQLEIAFETENFGELAFKVKDAIREQSNGEKVVRIPRDLEDDYGDDAIRERQRFVEDFTGKRLDHVTNYSFDPHVLQGNIEHFTGVAQVPLGFAGPILVDGEYAKGEFLIPLATTEGTLVASYNRGIKVLNLSGGTRCTVSRDCMQRAPVFIFESAREARDFGKWLDDNLDEIRARAEATTRVGKLLYIDTYLANKFAFCRFNFATGDAAGQNMVGRATFAACSWILEHNDTIRRFFLESNFATDKKASQVNMMRTRGKRVTAECVIKRDVLQQHMRVDPEQLAYHWGVAGIGTFLSGANNNGLHSPNAITAMFIATGQDVANVAESSAGIVYCEVTPDGNLYLSITIPSLIVATYGGGTGLATQRECLEALECYGRDKARKFAEIVAATVLAGEVSLASAISSHDWVSSHEEYGRNR